MLFETEYTAAVPEDIVTICRKLQSYNTPCQFTYLNTFDKRPLQYKELREQLAPSMAPGSRSYYTKCLVNPASELNNPIQLWPTKPLSSLMYTLPPTKQDDMELVRAQLITSLGITEQDYDATASEEMELYWTALPKYDIHHRDISGNILPILCGTIFHDLTAVVSKTHCYFYFSKVDRFVRQLLSKGRINNSRQLVPPLLLALQNIWFLIQCMEDTCTWSRKMYLVFLCFQQNLLAPYVASEPSFVSFLETHIIWYGYPGNVHPTPTKAFYLQKRYIPHLALRSLLYSKVFRDRPLSLKILILDTMTARTYSAAFQGTEHLTSQCDFKLFTSPLENERLSDVMFIRALTHVEQFFDLLPREHTFDISLTNISLPDMSTDFWNVVPLPEGDHSIPDTDYNFSGNINTYIPMIKGDVIACKQSIDLNQTDDHMFRLFPFSHGITGYTTAHDIHNNNVLRFSPPSNFYYKPSGILELYEIYRLVFTPGASTYAFRTGTGCATLLSIARLLFDKEQDPCFEVQPPCLIPSGSLTLKYSNTKPTLKHSSTSALDDPVHLTLTVGKLPKAHENVLKQMWRDQPRVTAYPDYKRPLTGCLFSDLPAIYNVHRMYYYLCMRYRYRAKMDNMGDDNKATAPTYELNALAILITLMDRLCNLSASTPNLPTDITICRSIYALVLTHQRDFDDTTLIPCMAVPPPRAFLRYLCIQEPKEQAIKRLMFEMLHMYTLEGVVIHVETSVRDYDTFIELRRLFAPIQEHGVILNSCKGWESLSTMISYIYVNSYVSDVQRIVGCFPFVAAKPDLLAEYFAIRAPESNVTKPNANQCIKEYVGMTRINSAYSFDDLQLVVNNKVALLDFTI